MSILLSLFTVALAVGSATAAAPPASYGVAFSDGLGARLNSPLMATLAVPSYSVKKWAWGTVPESCATSATTNNYCNVYDIEVYDVTYSDCALPWTFCRCNNSPMSATAMFDNVGRTPVRARQFVRYFSSWAGTASAYSNFKDITLFGDFASSPTVFYHEISHNLDLWVAGHGSSVYSTTAEWRDVVAKDTCVPDNYAKSTYTEDYAQVSVLGFYHANVGDIGRIQNIACMDDQFNAVFGQLYDSIHYVAGTTCNQRHAAANSVCMGPAARNSGACSSIPAKRSMSTEGLQARNDVAGITMLNSTFEGELNDVINAKTLEFQQAAELIARRSMPVKFRA